MRRLSIPLHTQIVIGLVAGAVAGALLNDPAAQAAGGGGSPVSAWLRPLGDVFIRALMMIAVPLVFASIVVGVSSLRDAGRMAKMGGITIGWYMATTALAIGLGLGAADLLRPGDAMDAASRERLLETYQGNAAERLSGGAGKIDIVDFVVGMVPKNPFRALADGDMLQIIVFALLFGVGLMLLPRERSRTVTEFFDTVSDVMIRLVDLVMRIAPYAVFALIASTVADFGFGILPSLGWYMFTVLLGLAIHTFVVYPLLMRTFTRGIGIGRFLRGMRPAQLVGFSTSSSAATLPVTYECVTELGAPRSVSGFVLPLGATINMDGTALYQGVAAVFIAQVFGMDLTLPQQLTVVLTATLASIGTAPVPGVGIIMLVVVLRSVGVPETGVALILGVDRLLDMCRTVTNITGDAVTTLVVTRLSGAGLEGSGAAESHGTVEEG